MDGGVGTILVGVDGSERAREALAFAARLARALRARLVVASVYAYRPPFGRLGSGDRALAIARSAAARCDVHCDVRIAPAASVAAGLNRLAATEPADLIVLGSRHRGRLGEALPGRVGHRLLCDRSRSVALVAVGEPARPLRYIGVLPGDEGAGPRAVALAAALAAGTAARLRVYEPGGGWEAYRSSAERAGVREVERAGSAADDVAAGEVDALVVPDWPHGLAGRLQRRGRPARDPAGRCVLVIVPLRVETVTPATVAAAR